MKNNICHVLAVIEDFAVPRLFIALERQYEGLVTQVSNNLVLVEFLDKSKIYYKLMDPTQNPKPYTCLNFDEIHYYHGKTYENTWEWKNTKPLLENMAAKQNIKIYKRDWFLPDKYVTIINECNHDWKTVQLFTSVVTECSKCGVEK